MDIRLYNTLAREKQSLVPLRAGEVGIYACGPTVYDDIHVGNARPLVVFDVLVRLLRYAFPTVRYVRNITDVDDKINARAAELNLTIDELCETTITRYHQDAAALNIAPPDSEPRATHHIQQMIDMITQLIAGGYAYEAEGHALFSVAEMDGYGKLSGRSLDEMIAGARVEVAPYKKAPEDFVLWKPSEDGIPGWDSPWGRGRPGWHIECSAMSAAYLGPEFDIHAGGLDLIFPHHENEIAQSCCAHGTDKMASIWVHNGYVTVEGEKMSKSLGNFTTVRTARETHHGEVIRYALLSAHYRAPLDFSQAQLTEAKTSLDRLYRAVAAVPDAEAEAVIAGRALESRFCAALCDDVNTPAALSEMHRLAASANKGNRDDAVQLKACGLMMGLFSEADWFTASAASGQDGLSADRVNAFIQERNEARKNRDFARADEIRDMLTSQGIRLLDGPEGTSWERT